MQIAFTAKQIAEILNGRIEGNPEVEVSTFSKIEEGKKGSLSFLSNPKYTSYLYSTQSDIVLVNEDFVAEQPVSATLIRVKDSYAALATLLNLVEQYKPRPAGIEQPVFIHETSTIGSDCYIGAFTYISKGTKLGKGVQIYPQVFVGENVSIGDNTVVYAGVKIYAGSRIGENCIIHAGAVIGADGFGFALQADGTYQKIPQTGIVEIGNSVEIGANTTVDRAVMGSTRIDKGVKLDNLIQIGHNVEIGENTVMAAQSGVAGSAKIKANCIIGGQVGISGHLTVGEGTSLGPQAGVIGNIKPHSAVIGTPPIPARDFFKSMAVFKKLPEMQRDLEEIKKQYTWNDKKQ